MPTFGNTTDETGAYADWRNYVVCLHATLPEAGSVSKLTARLSNDASGNLACKCKAVIYTSDGTDLTTLRATGDEISIAAGQTVGWVDLTFASPVSLEAGTYGIGLHGNADAARLDMKTGTGGVSLFVPDTYSDGPADPFLAGHTHGTYKYAIYGTYTTGSSGGVLLARGFGIA